MILIAQPAQAEWIELGQNNDGTKHYLDPESIRIDGDYRKYWALTNYSKSQKNGESSNKKRVEIDCKQEQYRFLSIIGYSKHMGRGEVVWSVGSDNEWMQIPPSTLINDFLEIVCNWGVYKSPRK